MKQFILILAVCLIAVTAPKCSNNHNTRADSVGAETVEPSIPEYVASGQDACTHLTESIEKKVSELKEMVRQNDPNGEASIVQLICEGRSLRASVYLGATFEGEKDEIILTMMLDIDEAGVISASIISPDWSK